MTLAARRWFVIAVAIGAFVFAATRAGGPFAAAFVLTLLILGPGLGLLAGLEHEDPASGTLLVVATSFAVDAVVGTILILSGGLDGPQAVGIIGGISIVGAVWPRRRSGHPDLVPDLDRSVPVLLVRLGRYPIYHGGVSAVRSFGRAGVPVHAIVEDRCTPAAVSRYLEHAVRWPTTTTEPASELLDGLRAAALAVGRRAVAIPSDDEAAVFLAEHAEELADVLILPGVDPALPRRLASKRGLFEVCQELDIPTAATEFPDTHDDVAVFAETATFPVVVKNVDPFRRLSEPSVPNTTVVPDAAALLALVEGVEDPTTLMLQEYLPREESEDWIFHGCFDATGRPLVTFTGLKLRSWPPRAGVTTRARAMRNPELDRLGSQLCRDLSYHGIVDLDWRYDRRDGQYKLLDFNPRMGAQFALFQTEAGVDVVRALHADLTGVEIPAAPQEFDRGIRVEHLDVPARFAYRGDFDTVPEGFVDRPRPRGVWFVADDLMPAFVMVLRVAPQVVGRVLRRLIPGGRQRAATAAASRGAANSVPQTKRMSGPKVAAEANPEK